MPSPGPLSLDSSQVAQEQADPEPWCQQRLFSLEVRESKRFIIAHELSHYFLHYKPQQAEPMFMHRENIKGKNEEENDADYFAACLLMPDKMFASDYHDLTHAYGADVAAIKLQRKYRVPMASVKRRIVEIQCRDFRRRQKG